MTKKRTRPFFMHDLFDYVEIFDRVGYSDFGILIRLRDEIVIRRSPLVDNDGR